MSHPRSRYRPDAPPDYSHRFHAGNIGDVWKHCVLGEVLRRAAIGSGAVEYLDSHAGEGRYDLGPTGEWTEGIGRVWRVVDVAPGPAGSGALERHVALCRDLAGDGDRPRSQPGSPVLAASILGPEARLRLWERDPHAVERLRCALGADPRVTIAAGDGLGGLPEALCAAEARPGAVVCLVDPAYGRKPEWEEVADVVARAAAATVRAHLLLWYPVKSLTRPNAMRSRLERAGAGGALAEVVTTSLEHQRHRLNGTGMILIRPPAGSLEALAAAGAALGALGATRPGEWSFRLVAWPASSRPAGAGAERGGPAS